MTSYKAAPPAGDVEDTARPGRRMRGLRASMPVLPERTAPPPPEPAERPGGALTALPEPERPEPTAPRWRLLAASARTRILVAFVVLLSVSAALWTFALRELLIFQMEDRLGDALRQELHELDRLLLDGRDPATGRPFQSLAALFDVYFARNVPAREEAMLGFVGGDLYKSTTLARFPLDRLPAESLPEWVPASTLAQWRDLADAVPGEERSASGRLSTARGDAYYRATRIRFGNDVGAFVVTILPASEWRQIGNLQRYGFAAAVGILLVASAIAWLIAGRVLAPVRALTETARSISQSNLTRRVRVRGTGEAADMARSFNAMLDRLSNVLRSQREFVEDTSHELRDPLTICRGHLELLGDDPEERRDTVALVLDELARMSRTVDDLQILADSEQPDFLRLEWVDLEIFVHELAAKAQALGSRRWRVDAAAEGAVLADRHRLTEALMNLAYNAVQHTEEDGTVAFGTAITDDEAHVWVRDTGTGISVSDQARIFDRFVRGTGAKARYTGSGLGLSIVKAIAEAHGGRVDLESRLGRGSTFTIVVPRQPDTVARWPES